MWKARAEKQVEREKEVDGGRIAEEIFGQASERRVKQGLFGDEEAAIN